jgi:hypothetical protein
MVHKVLVTVAIVLVVLFAIGGVFIYLAAYEPLEDMRLRADALPIPSDFVLASESYRGGGFGTPAELERVYHASWPGLCDSLRSIRDRAGESFDMGEPKGYEGKLCFFGAWYPAGWRSRWRNIRDYDLRLYGRSPELVQKMGPDWPHGLFVLYPKSDGTPDTIRIPPGRAKVVVQMYGTSGR